MPVYMIIEARVRDPKSYREYQERVPAVVAAHGGRYLSRGNRIVALSGDWSPERIVLLEFPAEKDIFDWLSSPEYLALAPLREAGADTRAILVESCADDGSPAGRSA
jgi:uncharacterized protein (DUF1330 family)